MYASNACILAYPHTASQHTHTHTYTHTHTHTHTHTTHTQHTHTHMRNMHATKVLEFAKDSGHVKSVAPHTSRLAFSADTTVHNFPKVSAPVYLLFKTHYKRDC